MPTALVLSGGGARGAFEAGVLRFICSEIGPHLDKPLRFDVISGTSAGALNGAGLANLGLSGQSARELSRIWRQLRVEDVWSFDSMDLLTSPLKLAGRGIDAILDVRPLEKLVSRAFEGDGIARRLATRELRALVLSATQLATGRCVTFIQHGQGVDPGTSPYPEVELRPCRITPKHVVASASIPLLFPPVELEDGLRYVDGSLRQNTPLSPVLRLGARKVLVLAVKQPMAERSARAVAKTYEPNLSGLLGKCLDALMLDPLEQDLQRLDRYNQIFDWGEQAYGPDFLERMNQVVEPMRGARYAKVERLLVRPRENLGRVCAEAWRQRPPVTNRGSRMLLERVADPTAEEAGLLSYLLFDRGYTAELERLGWEEARDREEELARFLA